MTEPDAQSEGRMTTAQAAGWVVCLLVLYVAAPGPIILMSDFRHHDVPKWLVMMYWPLGAVFDVLPDQVRASYTDYVHWWTSLGNP